MTRHLATSVDTTQSISGLITRLCRVLQPAEKISTTEWARKYRRLNAKGGARPGRYNPDLTPWVHYIHEALDDPSIWKVICKKSSQVGWTDGVLLNYLGRRIDIDPCPIVGMFGKDADAKDFDETKFTPMVEVTPRLADKIPITKGRDKDNRANFKGFPGGFMKTGGSNSPAISKSTPAPVIFVEEPDNCNTNVKGEGDSISNLENRLKTFRRRKSIWGGTPTIKGLSRVDQAYQVSDQRMFYVPCHHCGEAHVLAWENVIWQDDPAQSHEVYGKAIPDTAVYVCPHCGGTWNNHEKNRNVKRLYPKAHAAFHGIAGFYINEIYSPFPGSDLPRLVEKWLEAQHAMDNGDDTKLRSFYNNTLGLAYEYSSGLPDTEKLASRAEDYAELTAPHGALVVSVGVDVQHDRLAVIIRGWGRGEESWLLYWGELYGSTMLLQAPDPVTRQPVLQGAWADLESLLTRKIPHASGGKLKISAVSIDSSDGQTSDAVYGYVRRRLARNYMAVKGASHDLEGKKEIFSQPSQAVDTNSQNSKAHKHGLRPFIVGTSRAKDLVLGADEKAGRIKLTGSGPGRMHTYKGVRPDYFEQLTSEIKAPHKTQRNKRQWQQKSGVRNEALDAEVYALHAARSLKIHLWKEERWAALEANLKQSGLWEVDESPAEDQQALAPAEAEPEYHALEKRPVIPPRKPTGGVPNHRKPQSRPKGR